MLAPMPEPDASSPSGSAHGVAVIGGATAGAEVAGRLAERGAVVAVFEQNPRPYGKIEDGLPRWHAALRRKEYQNIREKLSRPGVHFIPNTRIGRDLDFAELVDRWGFSAVVLACGAWRDRPLAIEGADRYLGRGLVYQNPFIIWFNHAEEAGYQGPRYRPEDGVIVVGGGLASIDVAKVLMLETTREMLAERGIQVSMLELEVKGIPKILAAHGLAFEELGLKGCTLVYRRRPDDMPLVEEPEGASPEKIEKIRAGRRRILDKAMDKYRFGFEPLAMPDGLLVEGERLVGLRFRRTRIEERRVIPLEETFEMRGTYVISSIGSIPEPIPGIEIKGELFRFTDWDHGRLEGYPTVFSVGNVVTGKGNIVASRKHAARVSQEAIEKFLGLSEEGRGEDDQGSLAQAAAAAAREEAERVAEQIEAQAPASPETIAAMVERVRNRQRAVDYPGELESWLERVTPPDLA
jgi:NADPH-dependent glutamate synthase beta subunit-like oxidoreductase